MGTSEVKAKLICNSPLSLIVTAMRKCVGKPGIEHGDIISDYYEDMIKRKILKYDRYKKTGLSIQQMTEPRHESVLEHVVYTFELSFSRAALQEFSRHRIASPSVLSTRVCLNQKELYENTYDTGNDELNDLIDTQCGELSYINARNDVKKYAIPEAVMTSAIWTINARSLRNFLNLRSRKNALHEMRLLCKEIYNQLPITHTFLYLDCMWCE
jgi:thymidylate synthase (FAD)